MSSSEVVLEAGFKIPTEPVPCRGPEHKVEREFAYASYDALRNLKRTVDFAAYVGEGHGFRHTGSERDLYNRVTAFLGKYNTGRTGARATN